MGAVACCGGRCWRPAGRHSLSAGDSWQERVCNLTSEVLVVSPKPSLSTPLNPKLKFSKHWFPLNLVVRKGGVLWSLVRSVGWGIWGWCFVFFVGF